MKDMFDLESKVPDEPEAETTEEQAPEGQPAAQPPGGNYIVQNIVPMFPGWSACYGDPEVPEGVITFPVVALALVLLQHPDGRAEQTVRHLVSTPAGQIDDIVELPNFICVVSPGQSPEAIISAMQKLQTAS